MSEAVAVAGTRLDEPALRERGEVGACRSRCRRLEERDDICRGELLADDRAALEHCTFAGTQAIEAGGEKRLNRLGERVLREATLEREGDELLEEEGVSPGNLDEAVLNTLQRLSAGPYIKVHRRHVAKLRDRAVRNRVQLGQ